MPEVKPKSGSGNKGSRATVFGLSESELLMCNHYISQPLEDRVAWKSYKAVYGCADSTAKTQGPMKFNRPHIQEYLDGKLQESMDKAQVTNDEIIDVVADIMRNGEKDADRLSAADKLMKYKGMYLLHQEQGADKNLYLGMAIDELGIEAKKLIAKAIDSGLIDPEAAARDASYVDFEEIEDSYEDD